MTPEQKLEALLARKRGRDQDLVPLGTLDAIRMSEALRALERLPQIKK